ncbi:hypothetical protein P7H70_08785 [Vagococcus carniphilus]|uniref:Uncharacterized protein n=1 Tax=Vagococcus carniphilus TaxID=218144 RepID=A0AAW8U3N6_9ENTE|nr:hypothetical protein [Vagococcus carniphilus]MDT2834153.1 hypothetical protein [Vagococcus carniphilus]
MIYDTMSGIKLVGFITSLSGIILIGIGKKMPIIRLFFKDRSMIYQLFYGSILFFIGLAILFFT